MSWKLSGSLGNSPGPDGESRNKNIPKPEAESRNPKPAAESRNSSAVGPRAPCRQATPDACEIGAQTEPVATFRDIKNIKESIHTEMVTHHHHHRHRRHRHLYHHSRRHHLSHPHRPIVAIIIVVIVMCDHPQRQCRRLARPMHHHRHRRSRRGMVAPGTNMKSWVNYFRSPWITSEWLSDLGAGRPCVNDALEFRVPLRISVPLHISVPLSAPVFRCVSLPLFFPLLVSHS
jgi:hypothetical protein